ncbi:MAG TPA: hypothetical protein VGP46_01780, partial [Acidimicrobiales bacterium]|nr:hypothetical protein [Acidimicrobiales bacterium]
TVLVNGAAFHPAISNYPGYDGIETPAVDSTWQRDFYLTISAVSSTGKGPASVSIVDQPLVFWLWVGGVVTGLGALLAAVPGKRRRKTEAGKAPPSGRLEGGDDSEDEAGTHGAGEAVAAGVGAGPAGESSSAGDGSDPVGSPVGAPV